ncbi:hypothetical protein EV426DRAFT_719164 [Tirmania nivea]|nr:hypothetical protein EV426DRAFT_719164 [Tirmania nivea]
MGITSKSGPPTAVGETKPLSSAIPTKKPTFNLHHHDPTSSPPSTFRTILGVLFLLGISVCGFKYLSTGQNVQLHDFYTSITDSKCNCEPTARLNERNLNKQNAYGGSEPEMDADQEMDPEEVIMSCIPQVQLEMLEHELTEAILVERRRVVELEAELEGYRPSYRKKADGHGQSQGQVREEL